jgi:hypothetical protein
MTTREEVISTLEKMKGDLNAKFKVEKIGLFGSFVKGEQHQASDIDVFVEFTEEADFFDLVGLSLFLEDKLRRKVDVVTRRALNEGLRKSVLSEVSYV